MWEEEEPVVMSFDVMHCYRHPIYMGKEQVLVMSCDVMQVVLCIRVLTVDFSLLIL